jgi:hypothetical protein
MRWEESNLPTYHSGNDRGKADDERAAWAAFNCGGHGIRRCSSSKDSFGSGDVGGGSSSKRWISVRGSDVAVRRRRRGLAMVARVWAKFAQDKALLIGFLHWIVDVKNINTFLVWIKLYLTMIREKSRRGQIRVGYDNGNRFPGWANTG